MAAFILASASPRRKDMLKRVGVRFRVIPPRLDEQPMLREAVRETAVELARLKVLDVAGRVGRRRPCWILSADTIVEIDGRILGKPENGTQADEYLTLLSGATHLVHTGVALREPSGTLVMTRMCTTEVTFREMSVEEKSWYIRTGEWSGAAGAYRIQQRGGFFVIKVHGSYSNVVGLPMETLYDMLKELGFGLLT